MVSVLSSAVDAGIAVVLAIVVLYWFRSDSRERLANADKRAAMANRRADEERQDKLLLIETVRANTEAMSRLESAIVEWHEEYRRHQNATVVRRVDP